MRKTTSEGEKCLSKLKRIIRIKSDSSHSPMKIYISLYGISYGVPATQIKYRSIF